MFTLTDHSCVHFFSSFLSSLGTLQLDCSILSMCVCVCVCVYVCVCVCQPKTTQNHIKTVDRPGKVYM